jgi:hypothetical protein
MHRIFIAAILSGILLTPLAVEADARPIIVVERGWHHGGHWGGPRWAPGVRVPFVPAPVLLPPLVVPVPAVQFVPVAVPQPVAVPVPVAPAVPVVPSGCGC